MGTDYECKVIYAENLDTFSNDPKSITDFLVDKHNFKLKGTRSFKFYLGCDFIRDKESYVFPLNKFINKITFIHLNNIIVKPKIKIFSSSDKGNHCELHTPELLDNDSIKKYQLLKGPLN